MNKFIACVIAAIVMVVITTTVTDGSLAPVEEQLTKTIDVQGNDGVNKEPAYNVSDASTQECRQCGYPVRVDLATEECRPYCCNTGTVCCTDGDYCYCCS